MEASASSTHSNQHRPNFFDSVETSFEGDVMVQEFNGLRIETNFTTNSVQVFNYNSDNHRILKGTFSGDIKVNDYMSYCYKSNHYHSKKVRNVDVRVA